MRIQWWLILSHIPLVSGGGTALLLYRPRLKKTLTLEAGVSRTIRVHDQMEAVTLARFRAQTHSHVIFGRLKRGDHETLLSEEEVLRPGGYR